MIKQSGTLRKAYAKVSNKNALIQEYNLTINNNNQKLFILVQTENNKETRSKMFLFISTNISANNFQ